MPDARVQTRLAAARDEARARLMEQLEKAGDIKVDDVRSATQLEKASERERRWSKFNIELLSRLFTTERYADEYINSRVSIRYVADGYFDTSWQEFKNRLIGSINSQISALQSIIERLHLIDEGEMLAINGTARSSEANLQLLIERFHLVARQLRQRYDDRSTLKIGDEYDVQDLLQALLHIFFNDIRKEDGTPIHAGAAAKIDFFLPEIETAVEVKKSRPTLNAKKLGEELIVDIERYQKHPGCRRLVCLVYDPDGLIANPRGVETDLSKQHGKMTVRVMIVPSH